jgi:hypothetical protein
MPASAEEEWTYWDGKATELRRTQLTTVQTSATKWSTLLTAILGVFGTVAFAGGLTTIDKLADPYPSIAKVVTTSAALVAVIGIYLLTKAGGGLTLAVEQGITATSLRNRYTTGSEVSMRLLAWGKRCAVIVALLVLGGSLLVLWVGEKEEVTTPPSVVGIVEGELVCGILEDLPGAEVSIAGEPQGAISEVDTITTCPRGR